MSRTKLIIVYKDEQKEKDVPNQMFIGNLVDRLRADFQLEDFRDGKELHYGLFRSRSPHEQLDDQKSVGQILSMAEKVYLAEIGNPWWQVRLPEPGTAPLRPLPRPPRPSPLPPVNPEPEPPRLSGCRLHLSANCVVPVSDPGVAITRGFIWSRLSQATQIVERIRQALLNDDRLTAVSRQTHCEIFREGMNWFVRAYKPVYINGQRYDNGMVFRLSAPRTEIVIGRNGWPMTIELLAL